MQAFSRGAGGLCGSSSVPSNLRPPYMTRATSEEIAPVSSTWYEGERLDNLSLCPSLQHERIRTGQDRIRRKQGARHGRSHFFVEKLMGATLSCSEVTLSAGFRSLFTVADVPARPPMASRTSASISSCMRSKRCKAYRTSGADELLQRLIRLCTDDAPLASDEGGDACDAVLL